MRTTGMQLVAALGVMLGVSLPSTAAGQTVPRPAFEAFYTRVGYDATATGPSATGPSPAGGTVRAAGLGGRVMWPLAAWGDASRSLAARTAVGLFGAYTPNTDAGFSAGQLGVTADLVPLAAPLAGRVEPFLSLGVGALRTSTASGGRVLWPTPRPELPVTAERPPAVTAERAVTHVLLAPGVGARMEVRPGVAVQGDLRNLVTFGAGARRSHHAFGTGVRLTF